MSAAMRSELSEYQLEVSAQELAALLGPADAHRKLIEKLLEVHISVRDNFIGIGKGKPAFQQAAFECLKRLLIMQQSGLGIGEAEVRFIARQVQTGEIAELDLTGIAAVVTNHRGKPVAAKTPGQAEYVSMALQHDLTFCIGPAGTGKTYLAMAMAVAALKQNHVNRIVLSRPIVEAGEALGFLPGDMLDKVDPYLRPLQDALRDILGNDRFNRQMERNVIEVIPLAYMRGRTFNDAFIVLDEAQNTTPSQMKMALTRMGYGSKMIVTGDVTQTDLPGSIKCGLVDALEILRDVSGIGVCELTREDIVRHDLVQRIVAAYETEEKPVKRHHAN